MRKHKDFMSEPDYGYIDIESCFEPIFEPPLETLEEWRSWKDEPEPTLENTSVYVTEPDGIQYFYCRNVKAFCKRFADRDIAVIFIAVIGGRVTVKVGPFVQDGSFRAYSV